jgi:cellulose 1,4-beta-cellobiosidase
MVLVMSIWDDHAANMLWLDSTYPKDKTSFGGPRGTCATSSGVPSDVEREHPGAHVQFSDIKVGDFGSTYPGGKPGPGPGPSPSGCPGGTLTACMDLCPSTPPAAFKACVADCVKRCDGDINDEFLQ